jgi:hypothetical protein
MNALQHAAAIAAHRDREAGVREVVTTARQAATSLERTAFSSLDATSSRYGVAKRPR